MHVILHLLTLHQGTGKCRWNHKTERKLLLNLGVMPMDLVNASYTFPKMIQLVLGGLQWQICMAYLDNVIIYSKSFSQHLQNLRSVFDRFRSEGLKQKPKKLLEKMALNHIQIKCKSLRTILYLKVAMMYEAS